MAHIINQLVPADIVMEELGKTYPDTEMPAVEGINVQVRAGEFVCVVGASGCGKSTVLRMIAGFENATHGTLTVAGTAVTRPGPERGVVFQDYGLFPWLTVKENIGYGPKQARLGSDVVKARTAEALEAVGLTRVAHSFPHQLSGGMQQRVAIARVLANKPAVMLMDEPFGALDALTRADMQAELQKIQRQANVTVVFVTHSIEEAVFLSDRVVVMSGGTTHGIPGHIREIVEVNLGEQRDPTSAEFNAIKRQIDGLVHAGHAVKI